MGAHDKSINKRINIVNAMHPNSEKNIYLKKRRMDA